MNPALMEETMARKKPSFQFYFDDFQKVQKDSATAISDEAVYLKNCLRSAKTFEEYLAVFLAESVGGTNNSDITFGEMRTKALARLTDLASTIEEINTVCVLASRKRRNGKHRYPALYEKIQRKLESITRKDT